MLGSLDSVDFPESVILAGGIRRPEMATPRVPSPIPGLRITRLYWGNAISLSIMLLNYCKSPSLSVVIDTMTLAIKSNIYISGIHSLT